MPSTTWIALLRGINLGAKRRVAMADLRALLEGLGYEDVRTLLQSGNAVFTAGARAADHEGAISGAIGDELGLDVAVLVRSASELASVVNANPFATEGADAKELHAVFLGSTPPKRKVDALDAEAYAPDEFALGKRVVYLRLPNGIQGARVPDWQKVLGVEITQRNWNTVTKLRDLTSG